MKKLIALILTTLTLSATSNIAYANTTTLNDNSFRTSILTAVNNNNRYVDISSFNLSGEQALEKCLRLKATEPELWAVKDEIKIETKSGKANKVHLSYTISQRDILMTEIYIDETVQEIKNKVSGFRSSSEKAKAVYDELIKAYDYDWTYSNRTEADMYKNNTGICTAFSMAYKRIMNELDIPCEIVTSKEIEHQWNVVKVEDGNWYNVDVAWGDIEYSTNSEHKYGNCLKSDFFFELLGHRGGVTDKGIKCNSKKYDLEV